ncbi:MAG: putative DNA binding domain-containing protein [Deltaproteobacteria bacterium]|jgi:ATP-dependent DNA helicase RecG|nr:putative DNA binding domain-containing protein [Deltaproteobacteria bacterium]
MQLKESESIVLEGCHLVDVSKNVVALTNGFGGSIFLGVAKTGDVLGLSDPEGSLAAVDRLLRSEIEPDVMPAVKLAIIMIDQMPILRIDVKKGSWRPYYLSGKGLRPDGVFLRKGPSTEYASVNDIRMIIREMDSTGFEKKISSSQDLDLSTANKQFIDEKQNFDSSNKARLGLLADDNLYTNLALLLSEQCPFTINVTVLQDTVQDSVRTRKLFSGSLFRQANDVYEYLDMINET